MASTSKFYGQPKRPSAREANAILADWEGGSSSESLVDSDSDESFTPAGAVGPAGDIVLPDSSSDSDFDHDNVVPVPRPRRGGRGRGNKRPRQARTGPGTGDRARPQPDAQVQSEDWVEIGDLTQDEANLSFDFQPSKPPGVQDHVDVTSELNTMDNILTGDITQFIIDMINEFATHKLALNNPARKRSLFSHWYPLDKKEFFKFLALLVVTGVDRKPTIKDYWSTHPIRDTPFFRSTMTRDRFEAIYHTMMHVSEVGAEGKSKIEPLVDKIVEKFQEAFYPFEDLSIDEMVIGWKGRWKNKQYNASKPKKYHIKTYGVCDSATSYLYRILVYFGGDTSYVDCPEGAGHAEKVFDTLLQNLGEGHHVFADRYYTTHKLVQNLNRKKTHFTGTLNINRKNFPPQLKTLKLDHRQSKSYRSERDGILTTAWRDKKAKKHVIVVSTKAKAGNVAVRRRRAEVEMPCLIHEYNQCMNGCDKVDQMVNYYGQFQRKTTKWWKRIFYWLLEVVQLNSYILYKLGNDLPKLTLKEYKLALVMQLLERSSQLEGVNPPPRRSVGRPATNPVPRLETTVKHLVDWVPQDRNCVVCSGPGRRKRTTYICTGCPDKPYLCPKLCFKLYHTKLEYN